MCQTRSCTKMKKSYFFLFFFFFLTAAFFKLLTAGREKSLMPRLSAVTFVKQQACVSVYIRKDALNHQHHFQTPARGGFFWTKHPWVKGFKESTASSGYTRFNYVSSKLRRKKEPRQINVDCSTVHLQPLKTNFLESGHFVRQIHRSIPDRCLQGICALFLRPSQHAGVHFKKNSPPALKIFPVKTHNSL